MTAILVSMITKCLIHLVSFVLTLQCNSFDTEIADIKPPIDYYQSTVDNIEEYLFLEKKRLKILKKYTNLFRKEQVRMDACSKYFENPINVYTAIKRLKVDLNFTDNVVIKKGIDYQASEFRAIKINLIDDIAKSVLLGNLSFPISTRDCFEISRVLYGTVEPENALKWLFKTLRRYETKEDISSEDLSEIKEFVRNATDYLDVLKAGSIWPKMLLPLKFEQRKERPVLRRLMKKNYEQFRFDALCRGEVNLSPEQTKKLRCYYTNGPSPFLRLAPVKTEQLLNDPAILLYYDVIYDAEISIIKELTLLKLHRLGINDPTYLTSDRISKGKWLVDQDSPTVARLSQRLSDITGLSHTHTAAEALQVANYGVGGFHGLHYDSHMPHTRELVASYDERIATMLLYLTNVEQGGATVFLQSGLTVFPVRNAGLFWKNLLPSGHTDPRTYHGACPVLRGSKIAANKWFRSHGQELLNPCPLKRVLDFTLDSFYR